MDGKHFFFKHVAQANLTGEQLRVLMCMLSEEYDGSIGMWQKEIADMLGLTESNVSRSIRALIEAGILSEKISRGHKDCPIWRINPVFEQQAILLVNERLERKLSTKG